MVSEKKLQEPLVQDASPLETEEPAPTADKEELPVIVFLFCLNPSLLLLFPGNTLKTTCIFLIGNRRKQHRGYSFLY